MTMDKCREDDSWEPTAIALVIAGLPVWALLGMWTHPDLFPTWMVPASFPIQSDMKPIDTPNVLFFFGFAAPLLAYFNEAIFAAENRKNKIMISGITAFLLLSAALCDYWLFGSLSYPEARYHIPLYCGSPGFMFTIGAIFFAFICLFRERMRAYVVSLGIIVVVEVVLRLLINV